MDKSLNEATDEYVNRLAGDEAQLPAEEVAQRAKDQADRALGVEHSKRMNVFFDKVSNRVALLNARLQGKIEIAQVGEGGAKNGDIYIAKTVHYSASSNTLKTGLQVLQIGVTPNNDSVEAYITLMDASLTHQTISVSNFSSADDEWIDKALGAWLATATF